MVRSTFRELYTDTIAQYEVERDKVDREIARLPPTLAEYERMKALERAQDYAFGSGQQQANHALAFHLQKPDEGRDIFDVGDGTLDDQPLGFQQSTMDSRFPSPISKSRAGSRMSGAPGQGQGSVVSKKMSKQVRACK